MTSLMLYLCSLHLLLLFNLYSSHCVSATTNNNYDAPTTLTSSHNKQQHHHQKQRHLQSILLGGTLYHDYNLNGIRDQNEPGVPSVPVQIRTCTNDRRGSTTTNSVGEFTTMKDVGCYYIKLDILTYEFTNGVDLSTGESEGITLNEEGGSKFWEVGIVDPNYTPLEVTEDEEEEGEDIGEVDQDVTEVSTEDEGGDDMDDNNEVTDEEGEEGTGGGGVSSVPWTGEEEDDDEPSSSTTSNNGVSTGIFIDEDTSSNTTSSNSTDMPTSSSPQTNSPTFTPTTSIIPTFTPTISHSPTVVPTISNAPTDCIIRTIHSDNIMSSSPIERASYGMLFTVSTPPPDKPTQPTDNSRNLRSDTLRSFDNNNMNGTTTEEEEYIQITSISLRTLTPLLNTNSDTNYEIYFQRGDYKGPQIINGERQVYDSRGDINQWTKIAGGNTLGTQIPTNQTYNETTNTYQATWEVIQEPLVKDVQFISTATPSDTNTYEKLPVNLLGNGGIQTLNVGGSPVESYLYKIPSSIFTPISMKKYNDTISFYVTLDRALMQYGNAEEEEWNTVDVENLNYDPNDSEEEDGMNVRIHVGEGVTSFPFSDVTAFYTPRRFLGKIWYEEVNDVPCDMHESAPSESPSIFELPPLPGLATSSGGDSSSNNNDGAVGQAISTKFTISIFLQQSISNVRSMGKNVLDIFKPTMLDYLNEVYIMENCIWGIDLDVEYQLLSRLDGVRRLEFHRRGGLRGQDPRELQKTQDITILQVEMLVKGVAYDDNNNECPSRATPATSITNGNNWEETFANIGIDYISSNSDLLGERLKGAHVYFEDTFAVAADDELVPRVDDTASFGTATDDEDAFPLWPVVGAVIAALLVLSLLCCFWFYRKGKQQKYQEEGGEGGRGGKAENDDEEEGGIPKGISIVVSNDMNGTSSSPIESQDLIAKAWPKVQPVPQLEEIVATRGLPRRRSEPSMATTLVSSELKKLRRSRSVGCMREVWINLNQKSYYGDKELVGALMVQLIDGTLYPVDDSDILLFEREKGLLGDDPDAPYVPCAGTIEHNFIDDAEVGRVEAPPKENVIPLSEFFPEEAAKEEALKAAKLAKEEEEKAKSRPVKVNPLVMQQVEMLEAKWKQLKEEYGSDNDSDDEDNLGDDFDVNDRIEQLMNHIEDLEKERKDKLDQLKRQEEEEEELARKRMVRGGTGINYNQDLKNDFVLRKKKKKEKKKKKKKEKTIMEEEGYSESSDEESIEEEDEDDEFDIKWMRLKVPLAAQNPEAMKRLVEQGKEL